MFFILSGASIYFFPAGATEKSQNHWAPFHRGQVLYCLSPAGGVDAAGQSARRYAAGTVGDLGTQAFFQNRGSAQPHQAVDPRGVSAAQACDLRKNCLGGTRPRGAHAHLSGKRTAGARRIESGHGKIGAEVGFAVGVAREEMQQLL